MKGKEK